MKWLHRFLLLCLGCSMLYAAYKADERANRTEQYAKQCALNHKTPDTLHNQGETP